MTETTQDAERLDWLEAHFDCIHYALDMSNKNWVLNIRCGVKRTRHLTLREAIDTGIETFPAGDAQ